jgi:hypothetical protein
MGPTCVLPPTLSPSPSTSTDRILPTRTSVRPCSLPLPPPPCLALSTAMRRASPPLAHCRRCLQPTPSHLLPWRGQRRSSRLLSPRPTSLPGEGLEDRAQILSRGVGCRRCGLWWPPAAGMCRPLWEDWVVVVRGRRPGKGSDDSVVVVLCAASMTSGHRPCNRRHRPFSYDRLPSGHPAMAMVVMPWGNSGRSHRRGALLPSMKWGASSGEAGCFHK